MRVGLLGGTFDPIHKGHLRLANAAGRQLKLSRVYLILSPRSPFKLKHSLSPVSARKKWMAAALRHESHLELGKWELERRGPTYSVITLEGIRKSHPKWDLYFILGSDSFRTFSRWREPEKILQLARLVVGRRPGTKSIRVKASWKHRVTVLRGVFPDISSTRIRALMAASPKKIRALVPSSVYSLLKKERKK